MQTEFPREGVIAALWLPVDKRGELDRVALTEHLDWLRGCGIHGIMALGSSGRFAQMEVRQRQQILEVIATAAGSLPVIANISDLRIEAVRQLAATARACGVAGVAVLPPPFYRLTDADQLAFFAAAADAAELPVLLYNFPELTGNRISPATISTFAHDYPLAGFKQSGLEFDYHTALIPLAKQHGFALFSGSDIRLPEVFELGADGCIGGLVNLVPEYMVAQFNHFRRGVELSLEPTRSRMQEVGRIVNQANLPYSVMAGIQARGWQIGEHIGAVSGETRGLMDKISRELGSRFEEWGLACGPYALKPASERVA